MTRMQELSLHILDVARNSIEAGATRVEITVLENEPPGWMQITIRDNGPGMDPADARRAADPFFTTRATRKVGLGLSLFAATCEACGGTLEIDSRPGVGTVVRARLQLNHIDRPPLGNMGAVLQTLFCEADLVEITYRHRTPCGEFSISTEELRQELGEVPVSSPFVLAGLCEIVNKGLAQINCAA
ncbi:MAG: ATP-binding protein [Armatimonadetes bacterium]|nr:ATP-binding protein [Armatimonadota bacterium]